MKILRSFIRILTRKCLGNKAELVAHRIYHRLLRSAGQFSIPETDTTVELLTRICRRSSTILDVGANVGRYSGYFSQYIAGDAKIYAFEPGASAYALCSANTSKNSNIVCLNLALGDTDKTQYLHIPLDARNNPVSALGWTGGDQPSGSETVQAIETRSLDGLVNVGEIEIRSPLFLKIDVEGAEMSVLQGAAKTISEFKPVLYFECELSHLERNDTAWQTIWEFLAIHGYIIVLEDKGLFHRCDAIAPGNPNYFGFPANSEFPEKEHYTIDEIAGMYTSDG